MRLILLTCVALIAAGGGGYYWLQGKRAPEPEAAAAPAPAPKLEVYVALAELAAGAILKPENLGRLPVAEGSLAPEMVKADAEGEVLLVGSVARQPLAAGVPIARSAVVQPGERGFLAAVLPQGMRAISIPITEVAGISGLVLPGDRVDIILTYSLPGDAVDADRDVRASETVMSNIRVLALDQRLNQTEPAQDGGPVAEAPPIARTATLQVSPKQAEMITLATTLGDLSLVLNSVLDGGETDPAAIGPVMGETPRGMTLDSDVTSLLASGSGASDPLPAPLSDQIQRIQIVRGSTAGAVELTQQTVGAPAVAPGQVVAAASLTEPQDAVPIE